MPLKVQFWRIEDAVTGAVLEGGFFSEGIAEERLKKLKRKHPAAFVNKSEMK
jgi:hypothetical protein